MLKKYLIERTVPNVGASKDADFKKITASSNEILEKLGPDIKWDESFVTSDKIFCVYEAANEDLIRKHAQMGGFPVDKITEIKETLNPDYGEQLYRGKDHKENVNINFS